MSVHRYWRVVGIETYGGGALEVSEFHLSDTTTTVSTTLTSNVPPDTGVVSNLYDNSTASFARWLHTYGLTLHWDLGSATEVNNVQVGSADEVQLFPFAFRLEWSDDDVNWSVERGWGGITWPGARATTTNVSQRDRYQFFKVEITANNGGPLTAIQEIEMRAVSGGPDFTPYSTPVWESSFYAPDNARGFQAFDGDYSDVVNGAWVSADNAFPQFVAIDVQFLTEVVELVLYPQAYAGGLDRAPFDFTLQASIDNISYKTLATFTGVTSWTVGVGKVFTIPLPPPSILLNDVRGRSQPSGIGKIYVGGENADLGLTVLQPPLRALRNFLVDRDTGTITGTVKEKFTPDNTPLHRRVRLYRDRDGMLLQETWSDAVTGDYAFYRVDAAERYTVLTHDYKHNYRAVAADNLVPT